MACATMKRTLDFDPLHSPGGSPKRRRCVPVLTPSSPSTKTYRQTSPFSTVSPRISPSQLAQNICQEWKRLKRRKRLAESYNSESAQQAVGSSHMDTQTSFNPGTSFSQTSFPSSSSFNFMSSPSQSSSSQQSEHLPQETGHLSHEGSAGLPTRTKDQPLFTLEQVIMICERMLKEQEGKIREEYDKVLSCKLAEQYDSFVRFNQDHMKRRFSDNTASYVS